MTFLREQLGKSDLLPRVAEEIERVKADYANLQVQQRPDGSIYIRIPSVSLPPGWNMPATKILVIIPVQYPQAPPQGFYADANLKLADGRQPSGGGAAAIDNEQWLRFCWSPKGWDISKENLWKYIKFVESRFRLLQ